MAIYQLGKVIRIAREALGMTQDQFVEYFGTEEESKNPTNHESVQKRYVICSTQALSRIEKGTIKRIKGDVLALIMLKLGMLPEQMYVSVLTQDCIGLNLKANIYVHICMREYKEAEKVLQELKPMLMQKKYPRNEQYLMETEATLAYYKKEINPQEYLEILFSALRITVPKLGEVDIAEWPFNWEEFNIFVRILNSYHAMGDKEKELELLLKLKKNVERKYVDFLYYTVWHAQILARLSALMCEEGQYEKSLEYCEIGIRECKESRILGNVYRLIYDSVWCKEHQIKEGIFPQNTFGLEREESLIKEERVLCKKQLVQSYYLSKAQGDFRNAERIKELWERYYPDEAKLI